MSRTKRELAEYARQTQLQVEKHFKELLPDVTLVKVLTKLDKFWDDDDDIVDINVVFDGVENLDIDKTFELRHRIWKRREEEDDPVPIFNFTHLSHAKEKNIAL